MAHAARTCLRDESYLQQSEGQGARTWEMRYGGAAVGWVGGDELERDELEEEEEAGRSLADELARLPSECGLERG
jgi:hypothetical protein